MVEDFKKGGVTAVSQQDAARGGPLTYNTYAQQRLFHRLCDLIAANQPNMSWSWIADDILRKGYGNFHRQYFHRLSKGRLTDPPVEIILRWVEDHHDPDIRGKLTPESIFNELGATSRDYYFHLPWLNSLEEWDEQLLDSFAGIYVCVPAGDPHSYLPTSYVRECLGRLGELPAERRKGRSPDLINYVTNRSILILKRTPTYYFYAAEFPFGCLFPSAVNTLDLRMTYEGVGVASSNSIHVFLRECLSRVPKIHSILISPKTKTQNHLEMSDGLLLYLPPGMERLKEEWAELTDAHKQSMRKEYALDLEADTYLTGTAQINVSPVPNLQNLVVMNLARDLAYYRKPADFLHDPQTHFIAPDIENARLVERLINDPLAIGEFQ